MESKSQRTCGELKVMKNSETRHPLVRVKDCLVGGHDVTVIAGPCAVEDEETLWATAVQVKKAGAHILRGGAYKPRTSPYSFQGLGKTGLRILASVGQALGMPVVTEVMDTADIEEVAAYADVLQIGARNMHNYGLLKRLGKVEKPVILKRGLSATIEEWLMAAEYVVSGGNDQVILCERGIRTYEPWTRNTLDLSAVALVKTLTHLPVIVDPSHATGKADLVGPMARAAVAAGADGLMIEVHIDPSKALSDGEQSLTPGQFAQLMQDIRALTSIRQRRVS